MWTNPRPMTQDEIAQTLSEVQAALEQEGLQMELDPDNRRALVTVGDETFRLRWAAFDYRLVLGYDPEYHETAVPYRWGCKAKTLAALLRKRAAARPAQRAEKAKERERDQKRREQAAQQQEREQKAKETLQALVTGVTVLGVEERWDGFKVSLVFASLDDAKALLRNMAGHKEGGDA